MALNLEYLIKLGVDPASAASVVDRVKNVREQLDDQVGDVKTVREYQIAIDKLTRSYWEKSRVVAQTFEKVKEYRQSLREVAAAERDGQMTSEDAARTQTALQLALKQTNAEYQQQSRDLVATEAAKSAMGNSYNEIRQQMAALSAEIRNTQDPLGQNAIVVEQLTEKYNALNTQLKDVDAAMGNHQRKVGEYENSIRSVANSIAVFQGPLGPIAGRLNSLATVLSRLSKVQQGATITSRALSFAMKAIPIFALIAGVTALTQFMRRSEEGQQRMRVTLAAIRAVVDTLRERLIELGKRMTEAFENPKEAMEDIWEGVKNLGTTIVEKLVDRVRAIPQVWTGVFTSALGTVQWLAARVKIALADVPIIGGAIDSEKAEEQLAEASARIVEGAKKTASAVATIYGLDIIADLFNRGREAARAFADEARENAQQAMDIQRQMNAVIVETRDLELDRSRINKEMAEARELARDMNISFEERLRLIREVGQAERDMLEREIANERERLRLMIELDEMHASTEQDAEAINEQRIKLNQLEEESAKKRMSLLRDENAVIRQMEEYKQRVRRADFEFETGMREVGVEADARALEMRNRNLEAAILRREQIEIDAADRIEHYKLDLFKQLGDEEEALRIAQQKVQLEIAQETADAEMRIEEIKRRNSEQALNAYMALTKSALTAVFGDNKSVATATAIIDSYLAANKALSSLPPPASYAAAAAALATGFNNVRQIQKTQIGSTSGTVTRPEPIQRPSRQFGFFDEEQARSMGMIVGGTSMPSDMKPVIVFQGDLKPDIMAIKVMEGNQALQNRGVTQRL